MKIKNILSYFDGMSCGQLALQRAGIEYENYYACEIDKYAIKVTQANFPETIQLGDVTKIDLNNLPEINLLIGGSPCQGFSFAGKQLNFDDPRSKLFFDFVKAKNKLKPKYFLLENVKMKKEYQDVISEHLGVEPIEINSSLVSAQNRKRLYWTNIPGVVLPEDKGILTKHIIDKTNIIPNKDGWHKWWAKNKQYQLKKSYCCIINKTDKAITQTARQVASWNGNLVEIDANKLRFISPIECERLQTVPDNYTNHVSNSQRYKMLGNGWTVDVIAHIFSFIR